MPPPPSPPPCASMPRTPPPAPWISNYCASMFLGFFLFLANSFEASLLPHLVKPAQGYWYLLFNTMHAFLFFWTRSFTHFWKKTLGWVEWKIWSASTLSHLSERPASSALFWMSSSLFLQSGMQVGLPDFNNPNHYWLRCLRMNDILNHFNNNFSL